MAPGPMTSRNQGGHNRGGNSHFGARHHGRIAVPTGRNYVAPQSRFMIEPNSSGGNTITLTEDEVVSIGADANGDVTVEVNPTDSNSGNRGRNFAGRVAERMTVAVSANGSVVLTPDSGSTLHLTGDPSSGAVSVVEVPEDTDLPTSPTPAPLPAP